MARSFDVLLGDVPVGRLALDATGQAGFAFFDGYKRRYPRPVLGQIFEDDLSGRFVGKGRLPVWFSNLLPEGTLRERAQAQLGRQQKHEIFLLAALVDDLPGAVRIGPATGEGSAEGSPDYEANASQRAEEDDARVRFSLAGMQDKVPVIKLVDGTFSKVRGGVGGTWIAKLPDSGREGVTVNEHAMMTWARLAGLDVPESELVFAIERVDRGRFFRGEPAFVVRRFDRDGAERRLHIEDMAQVFGQYAEDKYDARSYEDLGRVVLAVGGAESLDELVRRLVFVIASGNHDMHLKNWSLLYPDGVRARLSPAYDLVSTIAYPDVSDELALKLSGTRRWTVLSPPSFHRFASDVGGDIDRIRTVVDRTIDELARTRARAQAETCLSANAWERIDAHWKRVPLLRRRSP